MNQPYSILRLEKSKINNNELIDIVDITCALKRRIIMKRINRIFFLWDILILKGDNSFV